MCGIAGFLGGNWTNSAGLAAMLQRMAGSIRHRGPDSSDIWMDPNAGVGFAHTRLSIVDLSAAGSQPMQSHCGRFVIVYNGELYNHRDLRSELESQGLTPQCGWRGHSDTETLLQSISAWGLERALAKSVGMFAFALWDKRERRLWLVRDRFGEKPLYYGWVGDDFVFASELKAVRQHPRFRNPIDRRAVRVFVSRTYIPAPLSIYRRIFKLEPGCILEIAPEALFSGCDVPPEEGASKHGLKLTRYWSYAAVLRGGLERPIKTEQEALEELEDVLAISITDQSIADVPVGAFLSGGIDSSTIVALYQKYSGNPVRSFTIGFTDSAFNEADHAKVIAHYLGTIHAERYVTVEEALEAIPQLPSIYDEPFADSSQIPTFLISQFARESVTVAVTGDGGDELFAGYNRHITAPLLWQKLRTIPLSIRGAAGFPLSQIPSRIWQAAVGWSGGNRSRWGGKIQKALRLAGSARHFDDFYCGFLDEWAFEQSPVIGADEKITTGLFPLDIGAAAPDALRMLFCDATTYLPDDILCKVDRAAMAVSLETRVPFLDHRVAEVAARIPLNMKVRGSCGKHILRRLLGRELPKELFDRPKAGFGIPVGEWIKGPLRPWAENLLDSRRLADEGWFDVDQIRRRWRDHLAGQRESTHAIWAILMFQSWLDEQNARLSAAA